MRRTILLAVISRLERRIAEVDDDLGVRGIGPGCRPLGRAANAQPLIGHNGKVRPGFEAESESSVGQKQ